MEKRLEAFLGPMTEHGLELPPHAIDLVPHTAADGYAAPKRLLATKTPLSALLCAADSLALGALCALYKAGLQVPRETSIVGFDDIPLAAYATPPLTTVRQPVAALARTAALLLLAWEARGVASSGAYALFSPCGHSLRTRKEVSARRSAHPVDL
jgi:LacI family transcriptional regulator